MVAWSAQWTSSTVTRTGPAVASASSLVNTVASEGPAVAVAWTALSSGASGVAWLSSSGTAVTREKPRARASRAAAASSSDFPVPGSPSTSRISPWPSAVLASRLRTTSYSAARPRIGLTSGESTWSAMAFPPNGGQPKIYQAILTKNCRLKEKLCRSHHPAASRHRSVRIKSDHRTGRGDSRPQYEGPAHARRRDGDGRQRGCGGPARGEIRRSPARGPPMGRPGDGSPRRRSRAPRPLPPGPRWPRGRSARGRTASRYGRTPPR